MMESTLSREGHFGSILETVKLHYVQPRRDVDLLGCLKVWGYLKMGQVDMSDQ